MRDLLPFFVVLSHCAALARLFGMRAAFKYLHEPKSRIIYFIKKVFMQFFLKIFCLTKYLATGGKMNIVKYL